MDKDSCMTTFQNTHSMYRLNRLRRAIDMSRLAPEFDYSKAIDCPTWLRGKMFKVGQ